MHRTKPTASRGPSSKLTQLRFEGWRFKLVSCNPSEEI